MALLPRNAYLLMPMLDTEAAAARDQALLTRLRAMDPAAFSQLVGDLHGRLLRLARGFVADRSIAEEVVQETWLAVISGLDRFEGRSRLTTWIFRILSNRAKSRAVREQRSIVFSDLSSSDGDEDAVDADRFRADGMWSRPPRRWSDGTPEHALATARAIERIERVLDELPPGQRVVITLRDVEGLSSGEVCNILEISETNQRVLLHRARSRLRAALEEYVERT